MAMAGIGGIAEGFRGFAVEEKEIEAPSLNLRQFEETASPCKNLT
jgi:hypothetical protein